MSPNLEECPMTVPARVSLATLGVRDVARSTAFYQALGWELSSASVESTSFFKTAGGILGLYRYEALAADAHLPASPRQPFGGITLAINVESPEAVGAALEAAVAAGGSLLKAAEAAEWGGTSGYFADPDGHPWEVAHNPFFPLDAEGFLHVP
jgi:catechol 2,3-dioxygenase-like lactoylglutathione lyase family enzyme